MITLPQDRAYRHALTAYDFEWEQIDETPTSRFPHGRKRLVISLCGAYDERGYRHYDSVEAFIAGELVEANCGRRYYAHFGGASDMVFLLRVLKDIPSLSIKGLFSGSSAIVVSVTEGQKRWSFLDSFWTMRTSLRNIGTWTGAKKGEVDHSRHIPRAELIEYNEQDCRILFDALTLFQQVVNDEGGELRVTAASTALNVFLRRFLKCPIRNSEHLNEIARPAYIASRVEPLWQRCEQAELWDINSSFPYSMTSPIPGDLIGTSSGTLPDKGLWIADCEVESDSYVPAIPMRVDGRVFFPNGRFKARITSEDALAGDFRIHSVGDVWRFDERDDMADFASTYYAKRKSGGGFLSEVFKIFLNSLYGKFAERAEKTVLYVRPKKREPHWEALAPHIYLDRHSETKVEHAHVAISTLITARSRRYLLEHMRAALAIGNVYYVDTDSVLCDAMPRAVRTEGLGGLKLEAEVKNGVFQGPKLYAYETSDARMKVKAKGFSRIVSDDSGERTPLTYADFLELQSGESVKIERMRRIRELMSDAKTRGLDDYEPDVIRAMKRLRAPTPKRCISSDGSTRPWSVSELTA